MFIVIEGIDGTGKSTVSKLVSEKMQFNHFYTPGDAFLPIREKATSNKFSSFHYYVSSCYYVSEMAKVLDIVCDRYIYSTMAYNWPYSSAIPKDLFAYFPDLRCPDLVFLLTASREVRQDRMKKRLEEGGVITDLDKAFDAQEKALKIMQSFDTCIRVETDNLSIEQVVHFVADKISEKV